MSDPLESLRALERARSAHPESPAPGSDAEREALARFARFFSDFSGDRIGRLLPETYAEDVYFNDTLKAVRGRQALAHYLAESAAAVEQCTVEILDSAASAEGERWVRWKMMIRFKKLRRGIDTWTIGASHLRFNADGHVVYHQDYWNAADGLFQHIPVVGWMISKIKQRL
ncbi:nuclear transport factor 2 family protein [Pseudomarimonas arenosa]|uniref:Nuclear transport factor 2 family protein n=1 Tax=Pseudomarimonas arenosa TaxID=2774145 RepID=A0AAW3ZHF0_9GAMM|nr:nuclear transport factor 2 family protein [Pseudomarimonas arenosa]MBD8524547.1 nuclear transport factor 2 family protein [Pseudomarimonas arenosa]